ncbi:energy-coupling factor ABC transporter permease [Meridianimarinicoccus aquatilis]|uniref:Cobalt transporter n=1 Tax=Meridianimarinicoccus aquatilis TaxID=2552766 RepID=A0A4V3BAQ9_9RHOB|nr:energy-coupling factor ABC transporter permease [Fluviibacterium aquatile]TDL83799.1 hypothetical protein E2L05_19265 [Fluviibacterium aquatile]
MHIEPGVVDGAKIALSYATAAGATAYSAKLVWTDLVDRGVVSLAARSIMATIAVFVFFEILPHFSAGVSEVHFILGTTLLLILGAAPAAIGLAGGLLLQGLLFAPIDLPQFGMNLTTLLVPMFGLHYMANRIIAPGTAYVDLSYAQTLKLSAAYQGGIVAWVAFWAVYGQGFGAETLASIAAFGAAYAAVLIIEPIADLAVLAGAKALKGKLGTPWVTPRLYNAA